MPTQSTAVLREVLDHWVSQAQAQLAACDAIAAYIG
jgi:hypothetical protein